MSRIQIQEDRCKGCLLCTIVCPKQIVEQSDAFNAQGYKVVHVQEQNMQECIGCGFCAQMCPDTAIRVWKDKDQEEKV